jgi:FkbM family methyltransferase
MIILSQLISLACRIGGPVFAHQIYLRQLQRWRTFEPEFYVLDLLVDPQRIAVDAGANEGIYAGRMAQLAPKVHCFEPIPWFAAALRQKLRRSVVVHEIALSNRSGTGELRIPYRENVELHGTTTLELDNPLPGSTHIRLVPCLVRSLDSCIDEPVGFIKIDVEGHELAVLEGAQRILTRDCPTLLVESERRHNLTAPESVFEFLQGLGYVGAFLKEGRLQSLSSFDSKVDQAPENVPDIHSNKTAKERAQTSGPYVNNFIFSSPDKATRLFKIHAGQSG